MCVGENSKGSLLVKGIGKLRLTSSAELMFDVGKPVDGDVPDSSLELLVDRSTLS